MVVVLVRPEGPLNLGSVARLCGNFGCRLRLVAPIADRSVSDAQKMAHPSQELLSAAPVFATLPEALRDVSLAVATSARISEAAAAPWLSVQRARVLLPKAEELIAIVFGNERTGLAVEEAAHCPRVFRLPTPGPTESLHLSHAVAVTLTLFNAAAEGANESDALAFRASAASRATVISEVLQRLDDRGDFRGDADRRARFLPRLQELADKMDLSERDLELLRELLR